jgi:hypothetical protein
VKHKGSLRAIVGDLGPGDLDRAAVGSNGAP